jgi:hypothetical protein
MFDWDLPCGQGTMPEAKGIPTAHYTASKDNKAYAVRAAALLSEGTRSWSTNALWQAVSNDPEKKPCISKVGRWNAAETMNGDSPGCTSSNPSPEESMKRFVETHRLKRA